MAKVIDLSDRKKVKADLQRTDKLEGLKSLLQCSGCAQRCAKCGVHGQPNYRVTHPGSGVTFQLCSLCKDEYDDLLTYLNTGEEDYAPFWFNREWVRQWMAWLDYQWALLNYLNSAEVLQVLSELEKEE